jgi:hypothetical protein
MSAHEFLVTGGPVLWEGGWWSGCAMADAR